MCHGARYFNKRKMYNKKKIAGRPLVWHIMENTGLLMEDKLGRGKQ